MAYRISLLLLTLAMAAGLFLTACGKKDEIPVAPKPDVPAVVPAPAVPEASVSEPVKIAKAEILYCNS